LTFTGSLEQLHLSVPPSKLALSFGNPLSMIGCSFSAIFYLLSCDTNENGRSQWTTPPLLLSSARIQVNALVDLIKRQPTRDYQADLNTLQCVNRAALRPTRRRRHALAWRTNPNSILASGIFRNGRHGAAAALRLQSNLKLL